MEKKIKMTKRKLRMSKSYKAFLILNTIIMFVIAAVTLYPFLYLVAQSFSSDRAIVQGLVSVLPVEFNLVTYKKVLEGGTFLAYYKNTILYAIIGTAASLFFTAILAYPLSKPELRLNKFVTPFIIFTMYFGGGLIPNYVLMTALGLRNTVSAFLLPGLIGTYYVLLMKSFFANVPRELEEAGEIDGLSSIGVFFRIVLPLSKPIIATMLLFYMSGIWSNWFTAFLYLEDKAKWPVAYYVRQMITMSSSNSDPSVSADFAQLAANIKSCCMVLMSVPIICVYPCIQKYFVQGMMLGGVKE